MKDINATLNEALKTLKSGGTIVYPTDTVYGIGCDATNYEAVSKIYQIKQREESKALICLVSDFKMLKDYVSFVPKMAYDILKYANRPTTIIYDKPKHVAENLIAEDNTLAIRIIHKGFAHELIKLLKKPIVSTSANISGQPTPKAFKEIHSDILKEVDYVVPLQNEKKNAKPSSIIKLSNDGIVKIIR